MASGSTVKLSNFNALPQQLCKDLFLAYHHTFQSARRQGVIYGANVVIYCQCKIEMSPDMQSRDVPFGKGS
jgi:hypothetical protein